MVGPFLLASTKQKEWFCLPANNCQLCIYIDEYLLEMNLSTHWKRLYANLILLRQRQLVPHAQKRDKCSERIEIKQEVNYKGAKVTHKNTLNKEKTLFILTIINVLCMYVYVCECVVCVCVHKYVCLIRISSFRKLLLLLLLSCNFFIFLFHIYSPVSFYSTAISLLTFRLFVTNSSL